MIAQMLSFVRIAGAALVLSLALPAPCQQASPSNKPITPDDDDVAAHLIGELPAILVDVNKFPVFASIGSVPVQVSVREDGSVSTAEIPDLDRNDLDELTPIRREEISSIAEKAQAAAMTLRFLPFKDGDRPAIAQFEIEIPVRPLEESAGKRVPFPEIRDLRSVRILLSRTGCFGSCPSYRIEVHGDGTVLYDGGQFVAIKGQHRAKISSDAVSQLIEAFRDADYFSLRDKYIWGATDLPTYTTSFSADGKAKTVLDYAGEKVGMPESVSELEQSIDRLSGAERWTRGNAETVPALQDERFDFRSPQASEILTKIAEMGTAGAVRDLIAAGVIVSSNPAPSRFGDQGTPFANAAFRGDMAMLQSLLGAGFNNPKTLTVALERAASAGKLDAMRLLIQYGADPRSPGVLIGAAKSGIPDVVQEVLNFRPNVNERGENNTTALIAALQAYHSKAAGIDVEQVVRILLEAGADPNLANDKGETPLMLNARDLEIAKLLVMHGADVNVPSKDGFTPLLNVETVELTLFLLQHGADPFARDDHGETAIDWARKMNRRDQAAALQAAMDGKKL